MAATLSSKSGFAALLVLITALGWLVSLSVVHAQAPPVHVFTGEAFIDGKRVPTGTAVTAWIDGHVVAEAKTTEIQINQVGLRGNKYTLKVEQPHGRSYAGKTVTFQVRGLKSGGSLKWEYGRTTVAGLNSNSGKQSLVHTFTGDAFIDGRGVPKGTAVTAWIDGQVVAKTTTIADDSFGVRGTEYQLLVEQPNGRSYAGKTVTFQVRGLPTGARLKWEQGRTTVAGLNANSGQQLPVQPPPPKQPQVQQLPAHIFVGEIFIDGDWAPRGTPVTAYIDGQRVATTTTVEGNKFTLKVEQPQRRSYREKMVTFRVAGVITDSPLSLLWAQGATTQQVGLKVTSGGPNERLANRTLRECVISALGREPSGPTDMTAPETRQALEVCPDLKGRMAVLTSEVLTSNVPGGEAPKFDPRDIGQQEPEQQLRLALAAIDASRSGQNVPINHPILRAMEDLLHNLGRAQQNAPNPRQREELERIGTNLRRVEMQIRDKLDRLTQIKNSGRAGEITDLRQAIGIELGVIERLTAEARSWINEQQAVLQPGSARNGDRADNFRAPQFRQLPTNVESAPAQEQKKRGFFINPASGKSSSLDNAIDPTTLAVLGILMTLVATGLQLLRGN